MNNTTDTPKLRIHSKDEFELCYLRHQYVRRCTYSPTNEEIESYMKLANKFIYNTYFTYLSLFRAVSFSQDDLASIARVHVVSFICLFSLEQCPDKMEEFKESFALYKFRDALESDIISKNRANFTMFFKQRMQDLVRVCRQKSRNIRGKILEEFSCFVGGSQPPANHNLIFKEHESLGFKKIDNAAFKAIRKKADVDADATLFQFDNKWYIALTTDHSPLSYEEVCTGGINPRDNICYLQPDEIYEETEFDQFYGNFQSSSHIKKINTLKDFLAKYENKTHYSKEVKTAKGMLRKLGV